MRTCLRKKWLAITLWSITSWLPIEVVANPLSPWLLAELLARWQSHKHSGWVNLVILLNLTVDTLCTLTPFSPWQNKILLWSANLIAYQCTHLLGAFPFSGTSLIDSIDIDSYGVDRWDSCDYPGMSTSGCGAPTAWRRIYSLRIKGERDMLNFDGEHLYYIGEIGMSIELSWDRQGREHQIWLTWLRAHIRNCAWLITLIG